MRPIAISLLLLPALASLAQPQLESRDADSFHLSASVNLVVVQPTVRDREGRFASDLHEADFQVFENGARQSIKLFRHEDVPVTVGLVIDHSGSMRSKLTDVITAARIFVQSSRRDDQIFVVNFNENVTLGLPPGVRFSDDPDELARAISNTAPAGRTALYDAAAEGFKRLRSVGPEKKVLIIISAGGDNASMEKLAGILKTAEQSSDLVYTIGIWSDDDPESNPGVLQKLARITGGEAFFPREHSEVIAICQSIARDIRNQYTIGYVSSNAGHAGGWRTIHMTAAAAGHGRLTVRARSGYLATGETP